MKDLFEFPELIPADVQNIFTEVNPFDEYTYEECKGMLKAIEAKGYTFEYGLDAVPFNLCKTSLIKTNVDYIIDRAGIDTIEDYRLITEAYNNLSEQDREIILSMYVYRGVVYYTTILHRPLSETYAINEGELTKFFTTESDVKKYIDENN